MKTLEVNYQVTINKPIEFVFEFLSHQENHRHIFKANITCRQITEGPMQVGSQVVNTASFLGSKMEEHFEIIEFETNKTIRKRTLPDSTHPSEDCFTLTAVGPQQTQLHIYIIAWPKGILGLLLPIVRPLFKKRIQQDLDAFKGYLEQL